MRRFKILRIWNIERDKEITNTFFTILKQLDIPIITEYVKVTELNNKLHVYIIEYNTDIFKEEYINALINDFFGK